MTIHVETSNVFDIESTIIVPATEFEDRLCRNSMLCFEKNYETRINVRFNVYCRKLFDFTNTRKLDRRRESRRLNEWNSRPGTTLS